MRIFSQGGIRNMRPTISSWECGMTLTYSCWVSGIRPDIEFLEQSCRTGGMKWIMMTFLDLGQLNQTVNSLRVRTTHGLFTAVSLRPGKMLAASTGFIRLTYSISNQGHPQKEKNKILKYTKDINPIIIGKIGILLGLLTLCLWCTIIFKHFKFLKIVKYPYIGEKAWYMNL